MATAAAITDPGGMGLASLLLIVLVIFLVMGGAFGGFGHGMYFR